MSRLLAVSRWLEENQSIALPIPLFNRVTVFSTSPVTSLAASARVPDAPGTDPTSEKTEILSRAHDPASFASMVSFFERCTTYFSFKPAERKREGNRRTMTREQRDIILRMGRRGVQPHLHPSLDPHGYRKGVLVSLPRYTISCRLSILIH